MAAAQITPVSDFDSANDNVSIHLLEVNKVTQADWIELSYPALWFATMDLTGVAEAAALYPTTTINHGATVTATETAVTITTSTKTQWPATGTPFYIRVDDEIMEVSEYTDTTMVVRRGAMGTTAATHADGQALYVLNSIILGDATVNKVNIIVATRAVS